MKIAIIEDEPRIREGIRKLLTKADDAFQVVGEAENGREGMELLLREKPDLALVDIRMPEMDGIEMLQAVQERGLKPEVIILSAYSDFSYAQRAMKLGVSEYLLKPIVINDLLGAVRKVEESLRLQGIVKQGMRSKTDMLTKALFTGEAFDAQMLEYARLNMGLAEDTRFAVMLLHPAVSSVTCPWDVEKALEGELKATGEHIVIPANNRGDAVVIWDAVEDDAHLVFILEKRILAQWKGERQFVAEIALCQGLNALHSTYQALQGHLEYGLIGDNGRLLRYPDIISWELEMFSYPIELESAARTSLARHDAAAVRARIKDFGHLFAQRHPYAPREIKEAHVRFLWALLSTARELGNHAIENISRQTLLERIMGAVHPSELSTLLREIGEQLCQEQGDSKPISLLVRRAESLMKEHYAQGITLDEIAQKLSVTSEYLGTQIHRELGVTFGTLMKQLRVERAKALFLSTDKKLYEVSSMVGYADSKYFSKVFQSVTGMLPAEFRRINK